MGGEGISSMAGMKSTVSGSRCKMSLSKDGSDIRKRCGNGGGEGGGVGATVDESEEDPSLSSDSLTCGGSGSGCAAEDDESGNVGSASVSGDEGLSGEGDRSGVGVWDVSVDRVFCSCTWCSCEWWSAR